MSSIMISPETWLQMSYPPFQFFIFSPKFVMRQAYCNSLCVDEMKILLRVE